MQLFCRPSGGGGRVWPLVAARWRSVFKRSNGLLPGGKPGLSRYRSPAHSNGSSGALHGMARAPDRTTCRSRQCRCGCRPGSSASTTGGEAGCLSCHAAARTHPHSIHSTVPHLRRSQLIILPSRDLASTDFPLTLPPTQCWWRAPIHAPQLSSGAPPLPPPSPSGPPPTHSTQARSCARDTVHSRTCRCIA